MKIIIATDIFGHEKHLDELCLYLSDIFDPISIITPYIENEALVCDEKEAYDRFIAECGHDKYAQKIEEAIAELDENRVLLVGFSAGASAIWRAVGENMHSNLAGFVGFYPTQIRNNLDLLPSCRTKIIFPRTENTFNVSEVASMLLCDTMIECVVTEYGHGFMNPVSMFYNKIGANTFNKSLKKDLGKLASFLQNPQKSSHLTQAS
jgi:dienelactone hydrolase